MKNEIIKNCLNIPENMQIILNDYHIDLNNIIIPLDIYDVNELIEVDDQKIYDIKCGICYNVLKQPLFCSKENNHVFCKKCIIQHLVNFKYCPYCNIVKKSVDEFYEKKEYKEKLKEFILNVKDVIK